MDDQMEQPGHGWAARSRQPKEVRGDAGQAAIVLVAVTAVLAVAMMLALATMGRTVIDRARAQTAADAAALASVEGVRADAEHLAQAHDAVLVAWSRGPGADEVTVMVRVGEVTAVARASSAVP